MKTGLLFSGQGAQYVGMGRELYGAYPLVKQTFDEASEALSLDMAALCFEQEEKLNQTGFTQPAILTVSTAIYRLLESNGLQGDIAAGLSLGEYTAYVAAGALAFSDAVRLVRNRGRWMTEAVPHGGAMTAIMNLEDALIEESCKEAAAYGYVAPANYNMPGQTVIGGEKEAVERAAQIALEKGAKRVIPLNVSGPFHTKLLSGAAQQLEKALEALDIQEPSIPVVTNVTGRIVTGKEEIPPLLTQQVMSPVRWVDCVQTMAENGVGFFVEIGPGRTLTSFVRKIIKGANIINVEDIKTFEKWLSL